MRAIAILVALSATARADAKQDFDACMQRRAELSAAADATDDLEQRVALLRSRPVCVLGGPPITPALPPALPAPPAFEYHGCRPFSLYFEASAGAAASPDGVAAVLGDSFGPVFRRCVDDTTNALEVRAGISVHARYGRLGFGPGSGGGGSQIFAAGGVAAEVNLPYGTRRIGVHGSVEGYDGWMWSLGPRWRTGTLFVGVDGFYTRSERYLPAMYVNEPAILKVDREVGAMVVVGYDGVGAAAFTALGVAAGAIGVVLGANQD